MLALLGLAAAQCESGRLVDTIQIARYAPSCCAGDSYIWFDDVTQEQIDSMRGAYVTVAPGTQPDMELPTSEYLINNGMTLKMRDNGTQVYENETEGTWHPYLYLEYATYPADYPPNEPHAGAVNYSIGANRDGDVYDQYAHGNGAAVFRIYVDECPFPPSAPPPPPVTAMCAQGYWPLYLTEAEARAVSPINETHIHEFNGVEYYMPNDFVGAMHAEENTNCPFHATGLPPASPPEPPAIPPPRDPPSPPAPPAPPPPYQMPVALQVLLITTIPAALLICIVVAWIWWCIYYSSPGGREQNARENAMQKRRFFKLDVAQ
tara:strand:- start:691 stop:1650 length:960 start_codon:yes stop_codon:yes gene_type:complete